MPISSNPDNYYNGKAKPKHHKFGLFSFIVVMAIGAIFALTASTMIIRSNYTKPNWVKINGQVVSITPMLNNGTTTYSPVVNYEVNSQLYTVNDSVSSSSRPDIGSSITVAYNPAHPEQAQVVQNSSSRVMAYSFLSIGILCLVIAPIAYVQSSRRHKDMKALKITGHRLQGVLTNVQTLPGMNHDLGYKIVVTATDLNGQVQNYVSDSLTGIGGLAMADFHNSPIAIDVYVNPNKPEDYYVDVSEIPSLTPERIVELIQSARHGQPQNFATNEIPNWPQSTTPPTPPSTPYPPVQPTYPTPPTYPMPPTPPTPPTQP